MSQEKSYVEQKHGLKQQNRNTKKFPQNLPLKNKTKTLGKQFSRFGTGKDWLPRDQ